MHFQPLPIAAAVVAALAAPALALGAKAPDPVVVHNTLAEPVPTSIVGTPTVGIDPDANTVRIAGGAPATPEPFQQRITEADPDGPAAACGDVRVPAGKLLTIENVLVSSPNAGADSSAFLRVTPGSAVFAEVPLDGSGSVRRGQLQTTLLAGHVEEPGPSDFDVEVCLSAGLLNALVTGTLSPATP